ncbi:MAG: DUF6282 family protein [Oscillospiraceae bacterium]|nr:DUF6282 family protein [Oscillospiraceae bacterium]
MGNRELAKEMLKGAIDIHVHGGPDIFPRPLNDIEVARKAQEAGMRAVLLKSHTEGTAGRATVATYVTGFSMYGGLALNHPVGGLNPEAVRVAVQMGAKQVWMPTIHSEFAMLKAANSAAQFAKQLKRGPAGIGLLGADGRIKDELLEIIDIIAEADISLATGHVSPQEAMAVIEEAKKRGVKKIVLTHPTSPILSYTIEQMKETVRLGVSMLEHVVCDTTHHWKDPISSTVISDAIRAIGPANTIMSTDSGQIINPDPVPSMENFICMMLDDGIPQEDIRRMTVDNPAMILGIDP